MTNAPKPSGLPSPGRFAGQLVRLAAERAFYAGEDAGLHFSGSHSRP